MRLGQLRQDRDSVTQQLSELVRQLDFAGIAIIWIFRGTSAPHDIALPRILIWSLGLFSLSLVADLLQYTWTSHILDSHYRPLAKGDVDDNMKVPGYPSTT